MPDFALTQEYAALAGVVASVPVLLAWTSFKVGASRKAASIPYPLMYAGPDSTFAQKNKHAVDVFNCAQRAHYQTLEVLPTFFISLCMVGTRFPIAAAGLGAAWVVGRVFYTLGYISGDPKKRLAHPLSKLYFISTVGLMGTNLFVAADYIRKAFF